MTGLQTRRRFITAAAAMGLSAVVCGTAVPASAAPRSASTLFLNGAGSTFIQPLMVKWAFAYANSLPQTEQVRINYQGVGSGAGISDLTNGIVDFACSDATMTDAQIKAAGGDILHIPLTLGPVAIFYNLPSFHGNLQLDGPTLAAIYEGKITNWNDKAIAALNPGASLPNQAIVVAHRSDGSGTSFIFTNYLSAVDSYWQSNIGASTAVNWPTGQGGKGTSGVAQIVSQSPGGIGYGELSYALSEHLTTIYMKNKAGKFVAPSVAGAAADAANAGALPADLRAIIVNSPGAASYPISGFSWGLLHQKAPNSKYVQVVNFLWWAIHQGQMYSDSGSLRYSPLPANVVKADEAKLRSITYNGKAIL